MFRIIIICALITALAGADAIDQQWQRWKVEHNRNYKTRDAEDGKRAAFVENLRIVREWNSNASDKLVLNDFADMTRDEYLGMLTLVVPEAPRVTRRAAAAVATLPTMLDYRQQGIVGPVRDQGRCGSCWAMSIADVCSSVRAKAGEPFVELSVQQLVDCSTSDFGCSGGDTASGASYAERRGLMTEAAYPYTAASGQCAYRTSSVVSRFRGHIELPSGDERALAAALVEYGPISVAINASPSSFQFYSTGILRDRSCTGNSRSLNHAVVLIGLTPNSWLIKNSWGTSWGLGGYCYLARNAGNMCGVSTYAIAVTV